MGKITLRGPVPKDHPMFSGGPELISHLGYKKYSQSLASSTDGEKPKTSKDKKQKVDKTEHQSNQEQLDSPDMPGIDVFLAEMVKSINEAAKKNTQPSQTKTIRDKEEKRPKS